MLARPSSLMPTPSRHAGPLQHEGSAGAAERCRLARPPDGLRHRRRPDRAASAASAADRGPPAQGCRRRSSPPSRAARSRRFATRRSAWSSPAEAAPASPSRASPARSRRPGSSRRRSPSAPGSALWGSMMAAGLSAQEMVDQSLNWQPEDYLDIGWTRLPRLAFAAMRGFSGLAKGEAVEKLFDRQLWHMSLGETMIPVYAPVYNIDFGRLETFGSKLTPRPDGGRDRPDRGRAAAAGRVRAGRGSPLRGRRRRRRVPGTAAPRPRAARPRDRRQHDPAAGLRGRGHLRLDRPPDGLPHARAGRSATPAISSSRAAACAGSAAS